MYSCKECSKEFRTNWELKRHYGNKRKCFKTVTEQGNEAGKQLLKAGKPLDESGKAVKRAGKTPNYHIDENIEAGKTTLETSVKNGRIYVVRTREFMFNNPSVYKIGRTCQEVTKDGKCKRCNQYPKGSEQVATFAVDDVFAAENLLINALTNNKNVQKKTEFGHEYFEGNEHVIVSTALEVQQQFRKKQNEVVIQNDEKRCTYCNKMFKRHVDLRKHESLVCKQKYDGVRKLEIELGIPYPTGHQQNECRFCNALFSRTQNLTKHILSCRSKIKYHANLQLRQQQSIQHKK